MYVLSGVWRHLFWWSFEGYSKTVPAVLPQLAAGNCGLATRIIRVSDTGLQLRMMAGATLAAPVYTLLGR